MTLFHHRWVAALLILTLSTRVPLSLHAQDLPVLGPAPEWHLTTIDGHPIGLAELKGKVVVVDFWATWCRPCLHEVPGYIVLQEKYADRGLVIVGISVDQKVAAVFAFAKARRVNYPLALATPEVVAAFGDVKGIPATFLIDREGRIRHQKVGAMEADDYEKLIIAVLEQSS